MLDVKFIRENIQLVQKAMRDKNREAVDLEQVIELYDMRKELRGELDELNRKRNIAAEARDIEEGRLLKEKAQQVEEKLRTGETELKKLLMQIPNIPSADTPVGPDESGNQVIRTYGKPTEFDFEPKPHWDLGPALGLIDNERAAKVSGARFTYLLGDLALLQFALVHFAFETLTNIETLKKIAQDFTVEIPLENGFIPVVPPVLIKPSVLNAMARLDPPEDKYYLKEDDLYLAGSAEQSVGSRHSGEVLRENELPLRYVGYSTCFRREAGSYGKDTKGILRVHQFDKIEMETFVKAEHAYKEQDFLVAIQEYVMRELELPYQVVAVCTGDMGFPDHRQIDIETWMPGQHTYRETHSADLIGTFQPRRLNTRVKTSTGDTEYVHMNDATLFAIGRTLIAILENYQTQEGEVRIPKVLQKYMGGKEKLTALTQGS
jgi:seryl-tRNA synthetase